MDNPKVKVQASPKFGMGLFAVRAIEPGEEIASFDGELYSWTTADEHLPNDPPLYVEDHAIPIGEWSARDSAGFARVANHSCDPNCGIRDFVRIVAMRPVAAGEEITWDYDMAQDDGIWDMLCRCGSPICRGRVAGYRFLPPDRREAYRGFVSAWLLEHERPFAGRAIDVLGPVHHLCGSGRIAGEQPGTDGYRPKGS